MNCNSANLISIAGYLKSRGINPGESNGRNGLWCCSPLRNEDTASFKIDPVKNVWYDFGLGIGGKLIDLVCKLENVGVPGALLILSGAEINHSPSFEKQENHRIEIVQVQSLQNKGLIQYLEQRKIPIGIASIYVEEIRYNAYSGQIKPYYAIGFKNDKGGYELRNGFKTKTFPNGFKGGSSPKAITTLPGHNKAVSIFEGFMDFLSAAVYFKTPPANTSIVLNSVSNLKHVFDLLSNFKTINFFFDNDAAGVKAVNLIQEFRPDAINQAKIIYPDHKDLNEFIAQ